MVFYTSSRLPTESPWTLVMNCPEFRDTLGAPAHRHLCEKVVALRRRQADARNGLRGSPGQLLSPHWLGTRNKQLELGQWRRKVPEPAETHTLFPTTNTQLWNPQIWSRMGGLREEERVIKLGPVTALLPCDFLRLEAALPP